MKRRTKLMYDEWGRLDAVVNRGKGGKKARARKERVGKIIIRIRLLEDRKL
jgi:hypothetical protein